MRFYNNNRLQAKLNGLSPIDDRIKAAEITLIHS
ncbi:hypothetical protein [Paenibacillus mucilaginosus]